MPFADELLGMDAVRSLTAAISAAAGTPVPALEAVTEPVLTPLTLRARTDLLRDALLSDIPADYRTLAAVFRAALAAPLPPAGWAIWPLTEAAATRALSVVTAGTDPGAFEDALALQAELTPLLTAEWGIRSLLIYDLDRALAVIGTWTGHPDEHVRRLASEGTRAYLPWGVRVPRILSEPEATLPILGRLYRDDSEYVRRSVANHLNDLARHRPDLVLDTCAAWLAEPDAHTNKLVRHALRSLVKKGDPGALALLGFAPAAVEVGPIRLSAPAIDFSGTIGFSTTVRNTGAEPARLVIDYVVHHRKANGSLTTKTFKHSTLSLEPGESAVIEREHSFRPITTRRYHPGIHAIGVQVNGVASVPAEFELRAPRD
ncbi:DNA alkylation repair protein [Mycetocola spongiae]|uniref:DNA alkylation repair protein n=1 Tax=Mycetocola spongiae TaxID=2859226 RepID=UPI001CF314F4|nr:DNA alkylation repair protein [Mycetocola spongiae]UCR88048.1 DNA alkylation repair protein [Mycetocola spongiae]